MNTDITPQPEPDVRLVEVIRTYLARRGLGESPSPLRMITQYWSKDGDLLAEVDPWPHKEREERAEELSLVETMARTAADKSTTDGQKALREFAEQINNRAIAIRAGEQPIVDLDLRILRR